ncbi:MAG: mechanosensitive ion channel [Clostridia bacterium]|nr:mechanosensitive ion channel [Clostridia bacterium]
MEGRKTKHALTKEILKYLFFATMIALTVVAYIFRNDISEYFALNLTGVELLDKILHYVPNLIISIQIIVLACVINTILNLLAKLSFGLTDKGKTIVNLINSLVKWIVIIASILWILSTWGVNTTTLLAGAGILALIIGLGAQSLIADVLAGISIVLEGKYVVGDIVVIDNWRGKIISIGIRTTELQDAGGNIKIINNSEIKSVINQTKLMSVATCSINVASTESLEQVENIIKDALPEIKTNIPAITGEIDYKGVNSISDATIELLFSAKCYEEDLYQVQRDLQRQLKLLLEKNNIQSFAVPVYKIDGKK